MSAAAPSAAAPALVVLGATGSLTSLKIVPALYRMHRKGRLPAGLRVIGSARHRLSDDAWRDSLAAAMRDAGQPPDDVAWTEFARRLRYVPGDVSEPEGLAGLAKALRKSPPGLRLYYLALAPGLYAPAIDSLRAAGLAGQDGAGCAGNGCRVIIEKPFGRDLRTAHELNRKVLSAYEEKQVFRIDHYLGKETVQNLLAFRFANILFEPLWNRNLIDHVQITVAETARVGDRGPYYDRAGVLRDMFQNHLMQLLCLIAMEPPAHFEADAVRGEKVQLLNSVRRLEPRDACTHLICGQYDGYHEEPGVRADSRTPTFAAVKLLVDNWRWRGVPFYLRSGKAMCRRVSEVVIQFVPVPHNMFALSTGDTLEANRLSLGIQPDEGVHLRFQTKIPDRGMELRSSVLKFHFGEQGGAPPPDAYERLLLDALAGDATLFMRHDEIESAWALLDPLIRAQESDATPEPAIYTAGSWGPADADAFLKRDGRAWTLGTVSEDP